MVCFAIALDQKPGCRRRVLALAICRPLQKCTFTAGFAAQQTRCRARHFALAIYTSLPQCASITFVAQWLAKCHHEMTRVTNCCRARLSGRALPFHSAMILKKDAGGKFLQSQYAVRCHNERLLLLLQHSSLDAEHVLLQYTCPCLGARPLHSLFSSSEHDHHGVTRVTTCC